MEKVYIRDIVKDIFYEKASTPLIKRETVRGIILNEKDEVLLLHIIGNDRFGDRDHFETPGGGVNDGETYEETLHREILEELGYTIDIIGYVGTIEIEYNLLNRVDIGNFFVARIKEKGDTNLEEYEKTLFKEVVAIPLSEIEKFYEINPSFTVGKMIHSRDLKAIEYYKKSFKD